MNKKIFSCLLAASLFFCFSCQRKEAAKDGPVEAVYDYSQDTEITTFGNVLRVDAALYTLENDTGSETDRTRWIASMSLGERVFAGEIRRATFSGDGRVYDYIEVQRDDGTRGLAWGVHIAKGGEIAVVTDQKANLYRSHKMVDVTGLIVPRKTIVGYLPETEIDGFVEIRYYDQQNYTLRQNYIRANTLSFREADIQSSILLQTAEPLKNEGTEKVRKDALLETALSNYPDSVFFADIEALLYPDTQAAYESDLIDTELVDMGLFDTESVDTEIVDDIFEIELEGE